MQKYLLELQTTLTYCHDKLDILDAIDSDGTRPTPNQRHETLHALRTLINGIESEVDGLLLLENGKGGDEEEVSLHDTPDTLDFLEGKVDTTDTTLILTSRQLTALNRLHEDSAEMFGADNAASWKLSSGRIKPFGQQGGIIVPFMGAEGDPEQCTIMKFVSPEGTMLPMKWGGEPPRWHIEGGRG